MANLDQLPVQVPNLFEAIEDQLSKQTFNGLPLLDLTPADIVDPLLAGLQERVKQELDKAKSGATELTAALVQDALFAALQPILLDLDESDGETEADITDIKVTDSPTTTQFEFKLGKKLTKALNLADNIGLPSLGLDLNGGASATIDLSLKVKFGVENAVSTSPIFFVDISPDEDFKATVTTELKDEQGNPLTLAGSLGFLQVSAANNVTATDPGSRFTSTFTADFTGGAANGRLPFSELGNLQTDPRLTADAALKFKVSTTVNPGLGINNGIMPSINLNLDLLDWNYDSNPSAANQRVATEALVLASDAPTSTQPRVELKNLSLDLGSFINGFTQPILSNIKTVTEPVASVTSRLTKPLVPFADFSLFSLAELLGEADSDDRKFVKQITEIAAIANNLPTGNALLPLGDFIWDGTEFQLQQQQQQAALSPTQADDANTLVQSLKDWGRGINVAFPVLDNPAQILKLLTVGQSPGVEFLTYTSPELKFDLGPEFFPPRPGIPIFGPIFLRFEAKAGASAQLLIGYDSEGLVTFRQNNFQNSADLLNGFYVGKPVDGNNLSLTGEISAQAVASAGVVELAVGGGLGLSVNLNAENGKVRGAEVISDPFCAFETSGALAAIIYASFKLEFGFFSITKRFNLVKKNVIEYTLDTCEPQFDTSIKPDPKMRGLLLQGGIVERQDLDDDSPSTEIFVTPIDLPIDLLNLTVPQKIRLTGMSPEEGQEPRFDAEGRPIQEYEGVKSIILSGQTGNDRIVVSPLIVVSSQLDGGTGDDSLTGGRGDDFLTGGSGNDILDGGEGGINSATYSDSSSGIYVNLAPDSTGFGFAYDGFTFIDQNGGSIAYVDKLKNIQSIEGSNYNDFITGNAANNNLLGAGGSDYLLGGAGNDLLLGGSGGRGDYLDGGEGEADTTTYLDSFSGVQVNLSSKKVTIISPIDGRSTITINANSGQGGDASGDRLFNIENLHGSTRSDVLIGSDLGGIIDGFWGDDIIVAGEGAETLSGDEGTDWLSYQNSRDGVRVSLAPIVIPLLNPFTIRQSDGFAQGDIIKLAVALDADDNVIRDQNGKEIYTEDSSFENLEGSKLNDPLLAGDRQNNIIKGLQGIDSLSGLEGDDTLIGGDGADSLNGGTNSTSLTANSNAFRAGGDTASYESSPTGVEVNLSTNTGRFGDAEGDTFQEIENLIGSVYSDRLIGNAFNNDINPGLRDPEQANGSIFDNVDGGEGRDRLTVDYSTRDYDEYGSVTGGFNTGSLVRGSQLGLSDVVKFDNVERLFIIGTSKRDELYGGVNGDAFYTGAGDDFVDAGAGNDVVRTDDGNDELRGGEGDDALMGGDGDDFVDAGAGNDVVRADDGNDELRGGEGDDALMGGDGNDILLGTDQARESAGRETDTLTGGAGVDTFILGNMNGGFYEGQFIGNGTSTDPSFIFIDNNYAVITDFNANEDFIVLHGADNKFRFDESTDYYSYVTKQIDSGEYAGQTGIFSTTKWSQGDLIAVVQGSPIGSVKSFVSGANLSGHPALKLDSKSVQCWLPISDWHRPFLG